MFEDIIINTFFFQFKGNKGMNSDMDVLLRVITSPCPLQLHFFNCTKVVSKTEACVGVRGLGVGGWASV